MREFERHSSGGRLSDAWRVERRVIWALMLREMMTRYGRHNIGFLWLFAEPMLFTLGCFVGCRHGGSLTGYGL